ncbi:S41 family peptidase [Microbacterium sp. BH-3-3-3]|uniref:S41 family peptidase n=1 Tax=Microbacterium sp. BH-3-3-3 TaxID=1906742 RepID=UPI0011A4FB8B|nr:S41 family peptidase [Microbacterium sp. BH-3-3-3]
MPLPRRAVALIGVMVLLTGCAVDAPNDEVAAYVDAAIAEMRDGIHADTDEFRDAVAQAAPELRAKPTIAETYRGLDQLAAAAGGPHSWLQTPADVASITTQNAPGAPFPVPTVSTRDGISTLTVPGFQGEARDAIEQYQSAGLAAMRAAAPSTTCGWIIDLRTNGGGSAWPMLAVVAPLLDDGDVVGLKRGETVQWATVANGGVVSTPGGDDTGTPGGFRVDAPVALLTSGMTNSAAEIVAIAFAGQTDAIRVGKPTAGMTTGNQVRELSDGARIILTTSYDVDRTGTVYDGPLAPDIEVAPGPDLEAARAAVRSRCA